MSINKMIEIERILEVSYGDVNMYLIRKSRLDNDHACSFITRRISRQNLLPVLHTLEVTSVACLCITMSRNCLLLSFSQNVTIRLILGICTIIPQPVVNDIRDLNQNPAETPLPGCARCAAAAHLEFNTVRHMQTCS